MYVHNVIYKILMFSLPAYGIYLRYPFPLYVDAHCSTNGNRTGKWTTVQAPFYTQTRSSEARFTPMPTAFGTCEFSEFVTLFVGKYNYKLHLSQEDS